ncbi:MAG: endospore germination permease [Desulfitobacteriaceae bacterium]|nr:endospore germination permease [Desulfitobacteriaceae bacterium]MDD4345386.1 endospore germination permease [Desulfitobacteriaceae bacterium]MDD4401501.1 endospore germination permease [Desulfitobacteriaceae bacterium]
MPEKGRISLGQAAIIASSFALGTGIFVLPAFEINWAREDAWLIQVLVTFPSLILVFIVDKLGRKFPGQTIIQYSETILGKYLGKVFGFAVTLFFFWTGSVILYELAAFLVSAVIPETPMMVFLIVSGLLIAYTVYNGLETIGRLHVWFIPITVFSLIFIVLLACKEMNLNYFQPFLANGIAPVIRGARTSNSYHGCMILAMAMLTPYINKPGKIRKSYIYAVIVCSLVYGINTVGCLAVFGPFEGGRVSMPTIELVKMINIADIIQRIEVLLILNWVGAVFTMSTAWFYFSVLGTAQLFNLKKYQFLVFPMILGYIGVAALNYRSYPVFVDYIDRIWAPYAAVHEFLLPAFLLLVAIIRRRGIKTDTKSQGV